MKKINIGIGIPTPPIVDANFALGNLQTLLSYTRENLKDLGVITVCYQAGVRTDRNRNIILDKFIESGEKGTRFDYVLWLDADMLYPKDMICKYLEGDFDVMGCLYFKRADPYAPIAFIKGKNPLKPFKPLNPLTIDEDKVYEVDGLGYGGMMVNMKVYDTLGDEKWTLYGSKFHLPYESIDHLTHDLVFCRTVQQYGFKVMMHGGVRPGHIADKVVTMKDWMAYNPEAINEFYEKKVKESGSTTLVVIPSKNKNPDMKLVNLLLNRSGMPDPMTRVNVLHQWDKKGDGYHATFNRAYLDNPGYDYYVYVADDVFPGRNWLLQGLKAMHIKNAGLCIPNDGKWNGEIATFGIISRPFIETFGSVHKIDGKYVTVPFNQDYKANYGDMELTVIAKATGKAVYEPSCVLTEVDFDKDTKKGHADDKLLFERRRRTGFEGRVGDQGLLSKYQQIQGDLEPLQSVGVPEFTTDWFTKNLPSWVKYILPHLLEQKSPHTLEIGTYEGRSAYFILDAVPETWVTTIDPFTGSGYLPMIDVKERCYRNLKHFGERVVILDQPSAEVLPAMTPDQFDFVYVDGLHTYESCRFDIENAWPLLKDGGIMCVDDYLWNRADVPSRPKEAIDEFLGAHKPELEILFKDYQVIVKKLCPKK